MLCQLLSITGLHGGTAPKWTGGSWLYELGNDCHGNTLWKGKGRRRAVKFSILTPGTSGQVSICWQKNEWCRLSLRPVYWQNKTDFHFLVKWLKLLSCSTHGEKRDVCKTVVGKSHWHLSMWYSRTYRGTRGAHVSREGARYVSSFLVLLWS